MQGLFHLVTQCYNYCFVFGPIYTFYKASVVFCALQETVKWQYLGPVNLRL